MPDFPFHVAGGSFSSSRHTPDIFERSPLAQSERETPVVSGSRRRKLWEVPHKFHCPVVGTCFDVDELRALMKKVMHLPPKTSDFVLHTTAVGTCETRGPLSEILQKHLEKRFQLTIRRFAQAKTANALEALWREATVSGCEIPAALWATWTHPACDALLEQTVYGDIHMIQHQIGTGTRADLKTLSHLRQENQQLREQLEKARQENEALRNEKAVETHALGGRIVELRAELAGRDATIAKLTGQIEQLRETLPDLKDRQALLRRVSDAEARCTALAASSASFERDARRLRELLGHAEETIAQLAVNDDAPVANESNPGDSLSGKCVLCVGGRTNLIDTYRQMIEDQGGRFLHHDGGLEESLHRIDGALAAADLVICQAGCISHNAYWRVKEQCKRTGKRCLFVKGSGVSSFGRIVEAAVETK